MGQELLTLTNRDRVEHLEPHPRELLLALIDIDNFLNQPDGHKAQSIKARAFDFLGLAHVDLAAWNQILSGIQTGDFPIYHYLDFAGYSLAPGISTILGEQTVNGKYGIVILPTQKIGWEKMLAVNLYILGRPTGRFAHKLLVRFENQYLNEAASTYQQEQQQTLTKLAHAIGLGHPTRKLIGQVGLTAYYFDTDSHTYHGALILGDSPTHSYWALRDFNESDLPWDKLNPQFLPQIARIGQTQAALG